MVRTDHNTQTLDSMFVPIVDEDKHRPSKRRKSDHGAEGEASQQVESQQAVRVKIPQSDTVLTSVKELRAEVIERNDAGEVGAARHEARSAEYPFLQDWRASSRATSLSEWPIFRDRCRCCSIIRSCCSSITLQSREF